MLEGMDLYILCNMLKSKRKSLQTIFVIVAFKKVSFMVYSGPVQMQFNVSPFLYILT